MTGNGYLSQAIPETNNLSTFTVSSWVNPDFEEGGSILTVAGKHNAFYLSIRNSVENQRTAEFSIYDGMQWHTVESNSHIQEKWTYLTGVFNGTWMGLYVNGVLESGSDVKVVGLSTSGQLQEQPIQSIQSMSNVTIGATENQQSQSQNFFSGVIDEVSIYGQQLNKDQILGLYEKLSSGSFIPVPLPPTRTIPPPIGSLNFSQNTVTPSNTFGQVEISKGGVNGSSLKLQGSGFVSQNLTKSNNVSNLTLSAWIKTDYSKGSADYTVISKENAFSLLVHNNAPPQKLAEFSIFDGIQWHSIESKTKIPESWTHLAATFNGSAISIYVNGTNEGTMPVSTMGIALSGELRTKTVQNLQSNASVLIGAEETRRMNEITIKNLFGGQIDEVSVYNSLLTPAEIQEAYRTGADLLQKQAVLTIQPMLQNQTATLSENMTLQGNATLSTISNATSANGTALVNGTQIPITPTVTRTKNNYLITQSPEINFEFLSTKNLAKLGKKIVEIPGIPQEGRWAGKNTTLIVDVYDSNGNKVPINVEITKLREGKFHIKLPSERAARAGHYNIVVTLVQDGKQYVTQTDFEWGLVSLNTNKSIYHPGENASFTIVNLDSGGHAVCNANIVMNIIGPAGSTVLSSGNGIAPEDLCGLYDAQYQTGVEGNYTVNITAQNPSGTAAFNTSFLVENSYPFDIIKTAQSKIDPVSNSNLFGVKIDVHSYVNQSAVQIQESVPASFTVNTDASVQTLGDTKILTWNKSLMGNRTSVGYTYSVPLIYPQLYALGPAKITYGAGQVFNEARPWFVAVDPQYGTKTSTMVLGTTQTLTTAAMTVTASKPNSLLVITVSSITSSGTTTITLPRYGSSSTCTSDTQVASSSNVTGAYSAYPGSTTARSEIFTVDLSSYASTSLYVCEVFSSTNTIDGAIGASVFYDVDTTGTPPGVRTSYTAGTNIASTSSSVSLGVSAANSADMLVDSEVNNVRTTPTKATSQTLLYSNRGGLGVAFGAGSSYMPSQKATTMGWSWGTAVAYAYGIATLKGNPHVNAETLSTVDKVVIIPTLNLKETLSFPTDQALTKSTFARTAAESMGSRDTISRIQATLVTISDSISSTDSALKIHATNRLVSESINSTDSVNRTHVAEAIVSESMNSSDVAGKIQSLTRPLAESMNSSDVAGRTQILTLALPESMNSNDVAGRTQILTLALPESMNSSDVAGKIQSLTRPLAESMNSSDVAGRTQILTLALPESMTSNDVAGKRYSGIVVMPEALNGSDTATGVFSITRALQDSMNSSDVAGGMHSAISVVTESLNSTETSTATRLTTSSLNETVGVSESETDATNIRPDQQLIDNSQTMLTVTTNKPNLVIASSNAALSSITIPSTVTSSTIDYSRISTAGAASITSPLTIYKDINGDGKPEIIVTIPAGTISGTSWDGFLKLPTLNNALSLSLPTPTGEVSKANIVIELGSPVPIAFNNAVRVQYVGQAGYHVGLFHNPPAVTEISTTCTADTQTANNALPAGGSCKMDVGKDLVVWTKHFTGFVTWTLSASPAPAIPGGGYGTGVTISGATGTAGLGGITTPSLTLYQVSYDICNQFKTDIVVGTTSSSLPSVLLNTPMGMVNASVAPLQPYAQLSNLTSGHVTVYEAPLRPQFKSFNLLVKDTNGTGYITSRVDVTRCENTISYAEIPLVGKYSPMAPKIFDVKFQVGNQSSVLSDNASTQYVSNETLSVSGIVYSPTPMDRTEIRFVQVGQNETGYAAFRTNVTGTNMSNIYIISGTIQRDEMAHPGITYWLWARNTDQLTAESTRHSIGVMPPFAINGTVGFETSQNVAEGSVQSPTIYVQNYANGSMFGTVSLVVNGTVVSSYSNQLFEKGTSVVQLDWTVPKVYGSASYPIQVEAQFYNTTLTSKVVTINTYPITLSMPLSEITTIQNITASDGSTTASPYIMYSSFYNTGNMTFKVVSPDGTCLIGSGDCLLSGSTFKTGTRFVSLEAGGHQYNVQYSGTGAIIQRFTITSSEPIVGPWKITIQKAGVEQTDLEHETFLKVKYLKEAAPLVSVLQ
ncbi:MAG TPA: LamG-like jellyroll fold domain-containing protein [Candidatus Nitrosotalea sp.]|nr:LamG-like jellyroll fold domain-containing protein [Candidatus Nitrosotalea sp.]